MQGCALPAWSIQPLRQRRFPPCPTLCSFAGDVLLQTVALYVNVAFSLGLAFTACQGSESARR